MKKPTFRPVAALLLAAPALGAQSRLSIPVGLHIGLPQGEFAENVDIAGGFGGGLLWKVAGPLALRADIGLLPKRPWAAKLATLVAKRVVPFLTVSIDCPASGHSRNACPRKLRPETRKASKRIF